MRFFSLLQMKNSIKDILARESKLASQNSVLVTLAAGTQEEIKVSDDAVSPILPPSSIRFCTRFWFLDVEVEGACSVCKQWWVYF